MTYIVTNLTNVNVHLIFDKYDIVKTNMMFSKRTIFNDRGQITAQKFTTNQQNILSYVKQKVTVTKNMKE